MCDVYIYYFVTSNGRDSDYVFSSQPATLEAIRNRGCEPVMESQIVVDHTQLDGDGYLVAAVGSHSNQTNDVAAQIWSLEVRAASRDNEAIGSVDGVEKYMLRLESRELRKQARLLKSRRAVSTASELGFRIDATDFMHFGTRPAAE